MPGAGGGGLLTLLAGCGAVSTCRGRGGLNFCRGRGGLNLVVKLHGGGMGCRDKGWLRDEWYCAKRGAASHLVDKRRGGKNDGRMLAALSDIVQLEEGVRRRAGRSVTAPGTEGIS